METVILIAVPAWVLWLVVGFVGVNIILMCIKIYYAKKGLDAAMKHYWRQRL